MPEGQKAGRVRVVKAMEELAMCSEGGHSDLLPPPQLGVEYVQHVQLRVEFQLSGVNKSM
jgi:hypothetical protein